MDILQDMRVFVRVVEAGSFTAAANGMDTSFYASWKNIQNVQKTN
jgi:DNA-binding transcriptional LysR family regulator